MIGIFDSGVGGMTVARAIEACLPQYTLAYFGDLARSPYGSKSPTALRRYARQNSRFLLDRGAKILVIACNSAASVATEYLRETLPVPIFEVITPAIDQALAATHSKRIGVIGTRATISSGIYARKITAIDAAAQVFSQACPLLVPLVEEQWLNRRETKMILRRYLAPLKQRQVDTLVLGCTHYPLLYDLISSRMGRRTAVIDSSHALADNLRAYLECHPELAADLQKNGTNHYYVSDMTPAANRIAQQIFQRPIQLEKIDMISQGH